MNSPIFSLLSLLATASLVSAANPLDAFPPPEEGMIRFVIDLPEQEDESLLKLELQVGKKEKVDSVNRYFFTGEIKPVNIEGWGFTRYVVEKIGPMAGTRIAPLPEAPKVERFISLGGDPYLVRYNSRLPIVVYLPEGYEVRYRIWSASAETQPVPEG